VYFTGYPANEEELIQRIGNADIVVGADVTFSEYILSSAPDVKMISLWSTGYDNVDLSASRKRGMIISNVPGYSAIQ
jgi:glycerate dehydrogenase